ncbi:transmembrane protein, putative [Bodo saltans]|uniref:Transmembrane protein, putative n=1 Tax=Bodo saltans TaxID=75058 RepID=A0A0S4II90_BODSA|nr:transmembrane protein, putative [Bodo saltans]|eukprot:CUE71132.1 transmembrane protein, putative [Bodo saltans]
MCLQCTRRIPSAHGCRHRRSRIERCGFRDFNRRWAFCNGDATQEKQRKTKTNNKRTKPTSRRTTTSNTPTSNAQNKTTNKRQANSKGQTTSTPKKSLFFEMRGYNKSYTRHTLVLTYLSFFFSLLVSIFQWVSKKERSFASLKSQHPPEPKKQNKTKQQKGDAFTFFKPFQTTKQSTTRKRVVFYQKGNHLRFTPLRVICFFKKKKR